MTHGALESESWRAFSRTYVHPVDAITTGATVARRFGHTLGGFTRQSGEFGYRFAARCRRCGGLVLVTRRGVEWRLEAPSRCDAGDAGDARPGARPGAPAADRLQ